jgi:hypothetical protein
MIGHSSLRTTFTSYAGIIEELGNDSDVALNQAFGGGK